MPQISLKAAASKIHQIVDQRKKRGVASPFFFIVGAGISYPQIPLARQIEDHCKAEAESYGNVTQPKSGSPIDTYSHWFSQAYPSPEELQRYLRSLMEKQPISKANLRLAHLVLNGTVARTVFTPNFDDMLTKALELFGKRPLVCDHPLTVSRMRIDSDDTQIIHVHGSYWFYDCCNLTQDIADRSGDAPMSVMLDQSLRDHSPLVVGYSGWEGDILMTAIKRRLQSSRLTIPLFWFCYRKDSIETLPLWLRKNDRGEERNDVFFVVPDDLAIAATAVPVGSASAGGPPSSPSASGTTKTGESSVLGAKELGLRADLVFDALVRSFNLAVPPLTENPLAFYTGQLRDLLGASDQKDAEPDTFYSFHTVIGRVEKAMLAEAGKAPDSLQSFRDAMSKADYRVAIRIAEKMDLATLSTDKLREMVFVLWDASMGLNDNSAEELAGYDLIVEAGNHLARNGPVEPRVQEQVALALRNKGITLGLLHRYVDEIAVYDELLRRYSEASNPVLQAQTAMALLNKGYSLGILNRGEEALLVYEELLRRFADSSEASVVTQVAKAYVNKGYVLATLNRSDEEIDVYDELLKRFSEATEPVVQEQVAKALRNKGLTVGALDRQDEAIALYDELLRRFADAPDSPLQEQVAKAMLNKGVALGTLSRTEEEIAVYDELLRRYAEAPELTFREQVAKALLNKANKLESLGRNDEAIAAYDELLRRFGDAAELALQEQVGNALFNKAIQLGAASRSEDEIAVYDDLLRRFLEGTTGLLQELAAKSMVNKGVALAVLKKSEEAIAVYDELLRRFNNATEPVLREQVAMALFNKGLRLSVLHRSDDQLAVHGELVRRFSDTTEPTILRLIAQSLVSQGLTYEQFGRPAQAVAAYEDVIKRFADASDPQLVEVVGNVREQITKLAEAKAPAA